MVLLFIGGQLLLLLFSVLIDQWWVEIILQNKREGMALKCFF